MGRKNYHGYVDMGSELEDSLPIAKEAPTFMHGCASECHVEGASWIYPNCFTWCCRRHLFLYTATGQHSI